MSDRPSRRRVEGMYTGIGVELEASGDGGGVRIDGGPWVAEAIDSLRDDLVKARAADARSEIQLPIESLTVELTVTATREVNGKAGP